MATETVVAPLPDCGTCGGTGMMALCGDTEPGTPCVLRAGHFGPHWGEDDVASDWEPSAICPTCQHCPDCGSTLPESGSCRFCAFVRPAPPSSTPEEAPNG